VWVNKTMLCSAALCAAFAGACDAQVASVGDVVNKAGRQRMLSQRCAKAYVALALNQERSRAQSILDDCVATFTRSQSELRAAAATAEVKEALARVDEAWAAFKAVAVDRPAATENVAVALALDAKVLAAADRATGLLQTLAGTPSAKNINASGRQRMLVQRMAKLQSASFVRSDPALRVEVDNARKEYLAAITDLLASPQTTPAIRNELELAATQWVFFENALSKTDLTNARSSVARDLLVTSENVTSVFDNLTKMYAGSM
jgi:Type IV pili methyl-accepting chemotaxis transducer N-term